MAKKQKKDTRQAIIEAAGELFAIRGLDGTGVRAIVRQAGTALCSVNYHFKNKEELYAECINYVIRETLNLEEIYTELEACPKNSFKQTSNALYKLVIGLFNILFTPDSPNWHGVLLIRAKHEKHPVSDRIMSEVTAPERIKKFLLSRIPELSVEDAYLWVITLTGQLQNFVIAKNSVLELFNMDEYNKEFIEKIAGYTAINLIKSLNLPEPEMN